MMQTNLASPASGVRRIPDVIPIFKDAAFEPELLHVMGEAYDLACKQIDGAGDLVKEVVARRIVDLVLSGQRDPLKLSQEAISKRNW
jgi:hypothetical protein